MINIRSFNFFCLMLFMHVYSVIKLLIIKKILYFTQIINF